MKVLWFINTTSKYCQGGSNVTNSGGWITSLQTLLEQKPEIELAVCFRLDGQPFKIQQNSVCYYPVPSVAPNKIKSVISICSHGLNNFLSELDKTYVDYYLKVVDDFNPDIIHFFGSEKNFGLISGKVCVPQVLYIQGVMTACQNSYLPESFALRDYYCQDYNLKNILLRRFNYRMFKYAAEREVRICSIIKNYMGRTQWDHNVSQVLSSKSEYFHCDEILRTSFYNLKEKKFDHDNRLLTTISSPIYKGTDLILKSAKILKELGVSFEWRVVGIKGAKVMEKHFGIKFSDVNVKFLGVLNEEQLLKELSHTTVYVHPSYIDNSPNSLCEAQLQALPVVATNVGGVSSLVEHDVNGYLVPANDPYQAAFYIKKLFEDSDLRSSMSKKAREIGLKRHDPEKIANRVMDIYMTIVNERKVR